MGDGQDDNRNHKNNNDTFLTASIIPFQSPQPKQKVPGTIFSLVFLLVRHSRFELNFNSPIEVIHANVKSNQK
jgi:hypothetical protein